MPMNDGLKKCKDRAMMISGTDSKGGYMKEDMTDEKDMSEEKTMEFAEFELLKEQLNSLRVVLD